LKKIYLDKTGNVSYNPNKDRKMLKMVKRLQDEFDEVWLKYENNKATYKEWEDALDKWLNAEQV
tara:strand:- start:504 stop:695 length:192 start_codon:yes stop_codon:yes gene_type:complete